MTTLRLPHPFPSSKKSLVGRFERSMILAMRPPVFQQPGSHREDTEDLIGRLSEIQQQLDGLAIGQHVAKETVASFRRCPRVGRTRRDG